MDLVFTVMTVQTHESVPNNQVSYFLSSGEEFDPGNVETASESLKGGPHGSANITIRGTTKPALKVGQKLYLTTKKE